ncbi:hypothetical protein RHSIM_Rhsim10G0131500 [Rhododendron simsii]|uniref:Uncharacterized protein n=1 Tax=Rhododendron simsii TaxID=118357 RepID=A0A834LCB8_RHOSS|nr:hypothetical protein RHSIM_Rhsim10G0131500 [Rhododendron simsii]
MVMEDVKMPVPIFDKPARDSSAESTRASRVVMEFEPEGNEVLREFEREGPPLEARGLVGRERQSKRAEDTPAAKMKSDEDVVESVDASSSLAVVPDPSRSGSL